MLKQSVLQAIAQAKRAVQDLVFTAVLVQRGAAVHVPGSKATYSETTANVSVFFSKYEAQEIDGDRIKATDWFALSFPETNVPVIEPNDIIRIVTTANDVQAGDYRVVTNKPVMAGTTVALNQMQLRLT